MLFGFDKTFRSFTMSPMNAALDQARRMARRRDAGGSVGESDRHADGLELSVGQDAPMVVLEIRRKLGSGADGVQHNSDGVVSVSADCLRRLGGGDPKRGMQVVEHVIADVAVRRRLKEMRTETGG